MKRTSECSASSAQKERNGKKKTILLISQSLISGGAERVAANLSLALADQYEVLIATYTSAPNEFEYSGRRINLNLQGRSFIGKIFCAVRRIAEIRRIKRKYAVDCAVSFVPQCDYANVLSKRRGEKTLIEVSNTMSAVYASRKKTWIRRRVLKRADQIVAISSGIQADLTEKMGISPEKIAVIHNSCDVDVIRRVCANAEVPISLPKRYIVTAGSFRHEKGHWHLIKAFSTIQAEAPDVSLMILGDGAYRAQYERLIALLGLEGRVCMPGFVNPPYGAMAGGEIFVLSSIDEGFGNVLIEAMACGVPVVAADCKYGPREILAPHMDRHTPLNDAIETPYGVLTPDFGATPIDVSANITTEERKMGRALLDLLRDSKRRETYVRNAQAYVPQYDNAPFGECWSTLFEKE